MHSLSVSVCLSETCVCSIFLYGHLCLHWSDNLSCSDSTEDNKYGTWHKKSYRLRTQIQIRVWIRAQLIIRKGAETGGAMGVGKIRMDRSVKRQRSANCLRIPANTISYLNKLWKVRSTSSSSRTE